MWECRGGKKVVAKEKDPAVIKSRSCCYPETYLKIFADHITFKGTIMLQHSFSIIIVVWTQGALHVKYSPKKVLDYV